MPMETMGDRIRMLRESKGLSQEQLAQQLGISKGAVSQWELGYTKNIKNVLFLALVQILGTSQEFLLFGPDQPKKRPLPIPSPPGRRRG